MSGNSGMGESSAGWVASGEHWLAFALFVTRYSLLTTSSMQLTKHWAATLDDYVIDLAWSPDGRQLAAASAAGPISLFATADGARHFELPGHENGTNCLAWRDESALPSKNNEPNSRPVALLASGG